MIEISLTHRQFQSAYRWATPRHRAFLDAAVVAGKKRVVTMPYVGWFALVKLLEQEAFTKWGVVRKRKLAEDKAPATVSALTAISRALAKAQGHPAMRREIVLGYSAETFTVWRRDVDSDWTLYPLPGMQAFTLQPCFDPNPVATIGDAQHVLDQGVTWWRATEIFDPASLSEHYGWESVDEDQATGT
jgi:hypothetical protein